MRDIYTEFANRYGIRHITPTYSKFDYTKRYYPDQEEMIEIEIHRSGFEQLLRVERDYDYLYKKTREEEYMRRTYPAIHDAYDKYRMLLELYK